MNAPPFPATIQDLDAWRVYADHLVERGDRLAEVIEVDLALPAEPTAEQVQEFHHAARSLRLDTQPELGWCLGHARTMAILPGVLEMRWSVDRGMLGRAVAIARSPAGQLLEELRVAVRGGERFEDPIWQRLVGALPASCKKLRLAIYGPSDPGLGARVLALLPASIRSVELAPGREEPLGDMLAGFVDDRLDRVDLAFPLDASGWLALSDALTRTKRVRVHVLETIAAAPAVGDRVVFGREVDGEPSLLGPDGALRTIARVDLAERQHRFGVISARAQIDRIVPERTLDGALVRHAGARWTTRSGPLVDGGVLAIGPTTWRFLERDVDARYRGR